MKRTFLLASFLLAASSYALELGLVVDASTRVVHRFDTYTGNYFGSFGSGFLTSPRGIFIQQSTGTAYVQDVVSGSHRLRAFNYNTGEYLGSTFGSTFNWLLFGDTFGTIASDGNYYTSDANGGTAKIRLDQTTFFGWHTNVAVAQGGVAEGSDGNIYSIDTAGNLRFGAKATFTAPGGNAWPSSVAGMTTSNPKQMAHHAGRVYWANNGTDSIGSAGMGGVAPGSFSIAANLDQPIGLAFAHAGTMYVSGKRPGAPGVGRIIRVDAATGDFLGFLGEGFLTDPRAMAIVVAPEPGTIAALALGVLIVARRKKRAQ